MWGVLRGTRDAVRVGGYPPKMMSSSLSHFYTNKRFLARDGWENRYSRNMVKLLCSKTWVRQSKKISYDSSGDVEAVSVWRGVNCPECLRLLVARAEEELKSMRSVLECSLKSPV